MSSCTTEPPPTISWQQIFGRNDSIPAKREAIYRAKIPSSWKRIDPDPLSCNQDTTLAICTLLVDQITITIHNFPYDNAKQRIAPEAQVARWQGQVSKDSLTKTQPYGHGGYGGLLFEAIEKENATHIIAFAQSLAPEHFQTLLQEQTPRARQQRGDYTIKVEGPVEQIQKRKKEILAFARSFSLIEEIPES